VRILCLTLVSARTIECTTSAPRSAVIVCGIGRRLRSMKELWAACGCGVRAAGDSEVGQSQLDVCIERPDVELTYEGSVGFRSHICQRRPGMRTCQASVEAAPGLGRKLPWTVGLMKPAGPCAPSARSGLIEYVRRSLAWAVACVPS
jgi:hypothetical protein